MNGIEKAKQINPLEFFSNPKDSRELSKEYHRLIKITHPDRNNKGDEWAIIINQKKKEAESILLNGSRKEKIEVIFGKVKKVFEDIIHDGEVSKVFISTDKTQILKVLKDLSNEDLFENGVKNLEKIKDHSHFEKYLIKPQNFYLDISSRNILCQSYSYFDGIDLVDLKRRLDGNVPIRHSAWIVNRILEILTWTHENKLCNLAILPQHIVINPETHGARLVDWNFSSDTRPFALASTKYANYPNEIREKRTLPYNIDIRMTFNLFEFLSPKEKLPTELSQFIKRDFRHKKTLDILQEYNKIIDRCWKREFIPLEV